MYNIVDKIFDFNEQVIGIDQDHLRVITPKQHRWTHKFCQEELTELHEAVDEADIIRTVDAIGDLIYGAMGTFKKMGLTRLQTLCCFKAIHVANMTKKRGDKGRGSDEDAVKPTDFEDPVKVIDKILFVWSEAQQRYYLTEVVDEIDGCAGALT